MRISLGSIIAAAKYLGLTIGLWTAALAVSAAPATVDFGPVATHREARQIWLRFSDDIVALGDDKAPDAADIACQGTAEAPKGHWLDGRRWVAEFAQPLGDGIACEVKPRALRTQKGESVAAAAPWRFDTGGPRLRYVFQSGALGLAKEEPVLAFLPSAPLDPASLQYLSCTVNRQSMPVTVLGGAERDAALKRIVPYLGNGKDAEKWMALRCGNTPWPADAEVEMVTGARLASAAHVANQKDESDKFSVRPVFAARFSCLRLLSTEGCEPRLWQQQQWYGPNESGSYRLQFTEAISWDTAGKIRLIDGKGRAHAPELTYHRDQLQTVTFEGGFAEGEKLTLQLPADLLDVDGRPLANRAALGQPVPTARLPAYVGMPQRTGILPWTPGKSASWPVATRGLEAQVPAAAWHFSGGSSDDATLLKLYSAGSAPIEDLKGLSGRSDTPYAASLRLLDKLGGHVPAQESRQLHPVRQSIDFTPLPLEGYGLWLVEADSPAYRGFIAQQRAQLAQDSPNWPYLPQQWADSRYAVVQVTNLRAEVLDSAKDDSLIWVTAIDSGEPVAGAQVDLWSGDRDVYTKLASLVSDAEGRVVVPASLHWNVAGGKTPMLLVRHGADMLLSTVQRNWARPDAPLIHSLLDRVLLRPGETVSLQHLVRQQTRHGFIVPHMDDQWKLEIYEGRGYGGGKPVYEQDLTWSDFGSAESSWKIPATARLGNYSYRLVHKGAPFSYDQEQGSFQVEEFRTPSFDADLRGKTVWNGDTQTVELQSKVSYFAGGAAAGQEIGIKGSYQIGVRAPVSDYIFYEPDPSAQPPKFDDIKLTLDEAGHATARIAAPAFALPLRLETEMSFADPNGEIQSEQANLAVWPQRHKLGMALAREGKGGGIKARLIALDERDQPLAGLALTVDLIGAKGTSKRACVVKTDAAGKAECHLGDGQAELNDTSAAVKAEGASGVALKIATHLPWYQPPETRKHEVLEWEQTRPLIGPALPLHVHSPFLPASL
ncbi:MAG TPA: MG2 domain-containing protein, partial [Burkholderiaceae bacterium]